MKVATMKRSIKEWNKENSTAFIQFLKEKPCPCGFSDERDKSELESQADSAIIKPNNDSLAMMLSLSLSLSLFPVFTTCFFPTGRDLQCSFPDVQDKLFEYRIASCGETNATMSDGAMLQASLLRATM